MGSDGALVNSMIHSCPPLDLSLKYSGAAVKLFTTESVVLQVWAIAVSAFSMISSSPNALIKCLVRPLTFILYGLSEVNLIVSPILYLHRPALVVMTRA